MEEKNFSYKEEGVEVTIPPQKNYENVEPVIRRLGLLNCGDPEVIGFELKREVINIELVETSDPGTYLTEFDPPIRLKVYYTQEDYDYAATVGKRVRIAFCFVDQWVGLSMEKHEPQDIPGIDEDWPGFIGHLRVKIEQWGDPSIFVGR
jgi:hypothetical protein